MESFTIFATVYVNKTKICSKRTYRNNIDIKENMVSLFKNKHKGMELMETISIFHILCFNNGTWRQIKCLLLLPTVYRLIACFSLHPCLCLVLWKVVSPSFSRPSSAPMSCR